MNFNEHIRTGGWWYQHLSHCPQMMQCMQFSCCFTLRSNRDCDEMWDTESWRWGLVSCISENGQHLGIWWIGYLQHLNVRPNIQNMIFWGLLLLSHPNRGKRGRTVIWAHGSIHSNPAHCPRNICSMRTEVNPPMANTNTLLKWMIIDWKAAYLCILCCVMRDARSRWRMQTLRNPDQSGWCKQTNYISVIKSCCYFSHTPVLPHLSHLISPPCSCTWRCSSSRPLSRHQIANRTMEKACSLIFISPAFSIGGSPRNISASPSIGWQLHNGSIT